MKSNLILFVSIFKCAFAGPARRGCGETQTFTSTNGCGAGYGGSWVECAAGPTAVPTFNVPECIATSSTTFPDYNTTPVATEISTTPPPYPTIPPPSSMGGNTTSSCSSATLCVDLLKTCGTAFIMYGGCYDPCTPTSFAEPTCTLPPVPETPKPESTTSADIPSRKPKHRPHLDICDEFPWRCAPAGW